MSRGFVMQRVVSGLRFAAVTVAAVSLLMAAGHASAQEKLRVGKSQADSFSFVPVDIGIEHGFFKKYGVDVEESGFAGDAKLQQAIAADAVDIGIGSGPALAFVAKGNPELGIAAMANQPLLLDLSVQKDGPLKSAADLKDKTISVSTAGSLTEWLVRETSRQQGWGPDGIKIAYLGSNSSQIAAMRSKNVDGFVADVALAYKLEEEGLSRILVRFGNIVSDFHIHVIYATTKAVQTRPNDLKGFLAGWFDTIAYIRQNKQVMVDKASAVMNISPEIASRTYDDVMPMFSDTGRFNPKALAILAKSFVQMGVLDKEPDMSKLYTEQFLPVKSP
ncbi:MAG TPA: ABC transporter substrate-binding protein [Stellaceae bacterium]|jgi:ABC-type nitrate/sulfonate/bicarbonate transport system substrate-binding protein|nr:ABC transporter substrate-binding protein [Stellaceae bacterium]